MNAWLTNCNENEMKWKQTEKPASCTCNQGNSNSNWTDVYAFDWTMYRFNENKKRTRRKKTCKFVANRWLIMKLKKKEKSDTKLFRFSQLDYYMAKQLNDEWHSQTSIITASKLWWRKHDKKKKNSGHFGLRSSCAFHDDWSWEWKEIN